MSKKEKVRIGVCTIIGILIIAILRLGLYLGHETKTSSISIIGGADGPTSIFLTTKIGNNFIIYGITVTVTIVLVIIIIIFLVSRNKK